MCYTDKVLAARASEWFQNAQFDLLADTICVLSVKGSGTVCRTQEDTVILSVRKGQGTVSGGLGPAPLSPEVEAPFPGLWQ